ncbi:hypothetical protein RHGRI_001008 [Rhododendron griersonianum]|uniref:Reverse transcriptase domain-containing protein n=1 Tax=Rhododendron griersonianum TaxID=479676 RepID=A0AAV6LLH8_9ERIC|nr:hypothetical protein RHGRI_001008 [Rhododendron griersonianum]
MVEILDERQPQAAAGEGATGFAGPAHSKPGGSKRPLERDYSSGATLSDEIPAVLRSDPQVREYLRQLNNRMAKKDRVINALRKDVQMVATAVRLRSLSPCRERYRSVSPRPTTGRGIHVKERLGRRLAPYDERIPSLSPDRSQVRGDVRDRLGRPKEDFRNEVPEESSGSFFNLAHTVSHETAIDGQRDRRHAEKHDRARRRNRERRDRERDHYHHYEWSRSPEYRRRHHREEVYDKRPVRANDLPVDFYLHPPKDMEDLMARIDQHCQMTEDIAARWKTTGGSGKTEPGRGGKGVHNIQKGKGKERWGEQKDYTRGPKPHEFEAGPIVFKDPLHELLRKIEHEPFYTVPPDSIPCPKVTNNKYRCAYHARRGHLTTWCPQFKEYLQDLVRKGHLAQFIDQEKTKERAGEPKTPGPGGSGETGQSSKQTLRIINVIHGMVDSDAENRLKAELRSATEALHIIAPMSLQFHVTLMHILTRLGCLREPQEVARFTCGQHAEVWELELHFAPVLLCYRKSTSRAMMMLVFDDV